jgi:hypothetical protein
MPITPRQHQDIVARSAAVKAAAHTQKLQQQQAKAKSQEELLHLAVNSKKFTHFLLQKGENMSLESNVEKILLTWDGTKLAVNDKSHAVPDKFFGNQLHMCAMVHNAKDLLLMVGMQEKSGVTGNLYHFHISGELQNLVQNVHEDCGFM